MIAKIGFYKSGGFLGNRSFLVESMSSRLFPDFRQMFLELWKQIVKFVSLSVQINFSRKKLFLEKCKFDFFSENGGGGGIFEFLGKKLCFGGKLSGELSERDSNFPEGLFEERHVFPKAFPLIKSFQTFSKVSIFVVFSHVYQKGVPVSRWTYWGNFSVIKQLFTVCFRIWAEYCRTLRITLQPIVKIAFYLSRLIFSWRIFYVEIYLQLDIFFRKSSGFF